MQLYGYFLYTEIIINVCKRIFQHTSFPSKVYHIFLYFSVTTDEGVGSPTVEDETSSQ